jgi:hypothetical protein
MDTTDLPLHLVELEKIEPLYAEGIRRKGKAVDDGAESGIWIAGTGRLGSSPRSLGGR